MGGGWPRSNPGSSVRLSRRRPGHRRVAQLGLLLRQHASHAHPSSTLSLGALCACVAPAAGNPTPWNAHAAPSET